MKSRLIFLLMLLLLVPSLLFSAEKVTIFSAASTSNMIDEIISLYNKKNGVKVLSSYASSGALVKQIMSGAPAGIFISANQDWMDKLEKENLVKKGSRKNFAGNRLVLITHKNNNISVDLKNKNSIISLLKNEKLVIGSPESVPAGQYAKQSFTKLGYWSDLQKNIVTASSVRDALAFVSRGEALMGAVFSTDAVIDKNVKVLATFDENLHDKITYPICIVKDNDNKNVEDFYNFLFSSEAKSVIKKYGFSVSE